MLSTVSSTELTQLLVFALRHADSDSIQLAIRCCRAMGEQTEPHFLRALDQIPMDQSYLRAAFEWSARFGLLSVVESLRNDSRPAVGYAVPFGVAEAQSVQQ